jgi:hypothetical protein
LASLIGVKEVFRWINMLSQLEGKRLRAGCKSPEGFPLSR